MRRIGYGLASLVLAAVAGLMLIRHRGDADFIREIALAGALVLAPLAIGLRPGGLGRLCLVLVIALTGFAAVDKLCAGLVRPTVETLTVEAPAKGGFVIRDPLLGFGPQPGGVEHAVVRRAGTAVYDVRYHVGPDGFRRTVSSPAPQAASVVFVGDAFTFGESVNDADTLPQRFAQAAPVPVKVTNAGFIGYGAHQVLAQIQSDRLKGAFAGGPRLVVYTALEEHLMRDEGLGLWDFWGPRYRLQGDEARLDGRFHGALGGQVLAFAARSGVVGLARDRFFWEPDANGVRLFGALAAAAQAEARRRDQAQFLVLLWDEPLYRDLNRPGEVARHAALTEQMAAELTRRGAPFVRLSSLVPDYSQRQSQYMVPWDGHPTALLNQRLAIALAAHLTAQLKAATP